MELVTVHNISMQCDLLQDLILIENKTNTVQPTFYTNGFNDDLVHYIGKIRYVQQLLWFKFVSNRMEKIFPLVFWHSSFRTASCCNKTSQHCTVRKMRQAIQVSIARIASNGYRFSILVYVSNSRIINNCTLFYLQGFQRDSSVPQNAIWKSFFRFSLDHRHILYCFPSETNRNNGQLNHNSSCWKSNGSNSSFLNSSRYPHFSLCTGCVYRIDHKFQSFSSPFGSRQISARIISTGPLFRSLRWVNFCSVHQHPSRICR